MEKKISADRPPLNGYIQKNLIELINKALPCMNQFSWLDANVRGVIIFAWWGKRFSIDADLKILEIDNGEASHQTRETIILEHCMQQEVIRMAWEEAAKWKNLDHRALLQKQKKLLESLRIGLDYLDTKLAIDE